MHYFPPPKPFKIILDSRSTIDFGATSLFNYTCVQCTTITVSLPNNEVLQSTHYMSFNYDPVPPAKELCILSHSQSSLLSVGKLFDSNCTTIFKNDKDYVVQNDNSNINLIKKSSTIENKIYRLIETLIIIHALWLTTLSTSTTIITLKVMISTWF